MCITSFFSILAVLFLFSLVVFGPLSLVLFKNRELELATLVLEEDENIFYSIMIHLVLLLV